jgi:hypothetical protein
MNDFGKERDFVVLSLCGFYSGFLRSFKEFLTDTFEAMFPLTSKSFLCSSDCSYFVLLWINVVESRCMRRQEIQQGNTTSQLAAPSNSISGMLSLLLSGFIWRYS